MTLGVKVIRKSGILLSKFISVLLLLLYLGQGTVIIYLVRERYELRAILREQQEKINELEEKLKILNIIEDFQVGFKEDEVMTLTQVIYDESHKYGYDPLLLLAVILTESSMHKGRVSEMGAMGLMQVKPSVGYALSQKRGLKWRGELSLFEPAYNIQLGAYYLFQLILKFQDVKKAIIAYNLGENALRLRLREGQKPPTFFLRRVLNKYQNLKEEYDGPRS
jgi:soluble lytic murein transglycosylase